MNREVNRRQFIAATTAAGVGLAMARGSQAADKPALLGGTPVHKGGWPKWPEWRESWEPEILKVLRSGQWCRAGGGGQVAEFEAAYAKLLGAKRCLATASGTTALITSLHVVGVDAGDEVICSPYTFIATYNAILIHKALPVFADTDPATLTMDPASIESRITERTRAILPVHIYGMPCDMDPINAIAKKHNLAVVEDACQAWLAEYKGRKCGTLGDLGCFSFQNSKHIPSGEGGAVTGNSDELLDRCHSFHNCGRADRDLQGQRLFHPRQQLPDAALPGRHAPAADRQAGQGDRDPPRQRRLSDGRPEADPRHPAGALAGEQPGGLASLPVPLRRGAVQRPAARQVHPGPRGRRHSLRRRLSGAVFRRHVRRGDQLARLQAAVARRAAESLSRQLPGTERQQAGVRDDRRHCPRRCCLADRSNMDHIIEAIRKIHAHAGSWRRLSLTNARRRAFEDDESA